MASDWSLLAMIAVVFAIAGWIKGVIGLGLPTIATGLLGVFVAPVQAASIVVLPAVLTNVWQMLYGGRLLALLRRLWPMLACVFVGTVATAGVVARADVKLTVALLGAALIAYALHALLGTRMRVPPRFERAIGAAAGLATGIISGTTGVFVVPTVPFLQAIDLGKDEMVQAIGLTAFTSAFSLAVGLGVHGALSRDAVLPAGVAVLAAFAGMALGQVVRSGLSLEAFRRGVLIGLAGLGATMLVRGLL
jgi:uncharacterized membrane protein YfcA